MDPRVVGQFRVERGGQHWRIPRRDDFAVVGREHRNVAADRRDSRGADEHRREGIGQARDVDGGLEAVDLPPERVPVDARVEGGEVIDPIVVALTCSDDQPRTRRQQGFVGRKVLADFVRDSFTLEELRDGSRLAAGQRQQFAVEDDARLADRNDLELADRALDVAMVVKGTTGSRWPPITPPRCRA